MITEETINGLSILVRCYYDYQRERMALDGKLGVKKDGSVKKNTPDRDETFLLLLMRRREELLALEEGLFKQIVQFIHEQPLWTEFLSEVKGCGESIAAVLLTEIDIHKAPAVSNLWSFAGLAPGKDRKEKGKKRPYNQFLRDKLCGVLGSSFLKCQSVPYSLYYYNEKMRLENSSQLVEERLRREDKAKKQYKGMTTRMVAWKDAYPDHRHKAAIRKAVKMFLVDLYVAWRTLEGLPVRAPYSEEYLGRKHKAA